MRNRLQNLALIFVVCLAGLVAISPIAAQQGKKYGKLYLKEYQPRSADEKAIVDVLLQYEQAFNSHDLQKLTSFFVKDAVYHPCGIDAKYPIASSDCQKRLKVNFTLFRFETYYDPEISVNGDTATANFLLETGDYLADYTFSLKRDGQSWLISAADYVNDRDKS